MNVVKMGNSNSIHQASENTRNGYVSMGSTSQLGTFFSRSSTMNLDSPQQYPAFNRSKTWNFSTSRSCDDPCGSVCCRSKTRIMESYTSREEALKRARTYRERNNFEAAQHAYLAALDFPTDLNLPEDDDANSSGSFCQVTCPCEEKKVVPETRSTEMIGMGGKTKEKRDQKYGSSLIRKDGIEASDYHQEEDGNRPAAICDELAQFYFEKGKSNDALRMYDRALSYCPKNVQLMYRRGVVLQQQSRLDEAAEAFRKALLHDPTYKPALFNLGTVLMRLRENDQAIGCFNSLLAIDPTDDQAQELLASCHENEGRFKEAASILQKVVQKDPSNFSTNRDLKRVKSKILN